jgi:sulfur-carrier protein adenylyltransferase/sulfurtransferase
MRQCFFDVNDHRPTGRIPVVERGTTKAMFSLFGPRISPKDLCAELKSPNPPRLLDVREKEEVKVSKLDGAVHIPIGQLQDRISEVDPSANWVVYCRSGSRSSSAVRFLLKHGIENVRNLEGGLKGYAHAIDPSMEVL